ncbi:MAG: hypothetical protein HYX41_07655, partial [Bdellovibrio sp.]|nr:hypothetical protein [Bdellovibrio sp.]
MTNVNWTKQLVLSALLLTLGMGAYWLEFKHKPEQEDKTEQTKKVFQVKDTPVQGLKLVDPQSSLSFVCVDFASKLCKTGDVSKWEIT